MTRRSWIQSPKPPFKLIPAEEYEREEKTTFHIMPDLPDFVSPIDGKVVKGRKGYREHCKVHNVTNASDFKETWKQQAKERKNLFGNKEARRQRAQDLARAWDNHTRKR